MGNNAVATPKKAVEKVARPTQTDTMITVGFVRSRFPLNTETLAI